MPNLTPVHTEPPESVITWRGLRELVRWQAPGLSAPAPGAPGLCATCRGPSGRLARCFLCELHEQCAPGGLADVVVPVAYAVKGGDHARRLWQYKSGRSNAGDAGLALLALLLVFLRQHRACLWRAAGTAGGPTHLAVVPTARARPGPHPLRALVAPYLPGPWIELRSPAGAVRDGDRDLDPGRFRADPVPGARVLLLDDTWTTGASAQSAAMALRRAGARSVVTVVLGRHIGRPEIAFTPARLPFLTGNCAVHGAGLTVADRRLDG